MPAGGFCLFLGQARRLFCGVFGTGVSPVLRPGLLVAGSCANIF
jgi:hypothetical protein